MIVSQPTRSPNANPSSIEAATGPAYKSGATTT
jgi:hypothetical protein